MKGKFGKHTVLIVVLLVIAILVGIVSVTVMPRQKGSGAQQPNEYVSAPDNSTLSDNENSADKNNSTENSKNEIYDIKIAYESNEKVYTDTVTDKNGTTLAISKSYDVGDKITITLPESKKYLGVTLNDRVGEAILYIPSGTFTYTIPSADELKNSYEPTFAIKKSNVIKARVVSNEEWASRRNIALNPYDLIDSKNVFPHVTASDWHANSSMFAPRNAIDGVTNNENHNAWPYQSWGPSESGNHWLKIDFGQETEVSEIGVYLRSDNSSGHTLYKSATLEFSDGTKQNVNFDKSLEKQTVSINKVKTSYIKITNLVKADDTKTWAGITEFEVYNVK